MTKKDYILAASLLKIEAKVARTPDAQAKVAYAIDMFVEFFVAETSNFDAVHFRAACEPAPVKNVKVTRKVTTLDDIRTAFPGADSKNRRSGKVAL